MKLRKSEPVTSTNMEQLTEQGYCEANHVYRGGIRHEKREDTQIHQNISHCQSQT